MMERTTDGPIYTAMGQGDTFAEKQAWWKTHQEEAVSVGANFFRYTVHDRDPRLILIEGWKGWPVDQGEPRWMVTKAVEAHLASHSVMR